jgi:hypothetical protein
LIVMVDASLIGDGPDHGTGRAGVVTSGDQVAIDVEGVRIAPTAAAEGERRVPDRQRYLVSGQVAQAVKLGIGAAAQAILSWALTKPPHLGLSAA